MKELNYLAQANGATSIISLAKWPASTAPQRKSRLAATYDEEGREITPVRTVALRHPGHGRWQRHQRFRDKRGCSVWQSSLETAEHAVRFNRRLVNACIRAQAQTQPIRARQLHVAIIGAGATGTELAGELHRTAREIVAHGLNRIDPDRDIKITLIKAAPRIFPALPEAVSDAAHQLLKKIGGGCAERARG